MEGVMERKMEKTGSKFPLSLREGWRLWGGPDLFAFSPFHTAGYVDSIQHPLAEAWLVPFLSCPFPCMLDLHPLCYRCFQSPLCSNSPVGTVSSASFRSWGHLDNTSQTQGLDSQSKSEHSPRRRSVQGAFSSKIRSSPLRCCTHAFGDNASLPNVAFKFPKICSSGYINHLGHSFCLYHCLSFSFHRTFKNTRTLILLLVHYYFNSVCIILSFLVLLQLFLLYFINIACRFAFFSRLWCLSSCYLISMLSFFLCLLYVLFFQKVCVSMLYSGYYIQILASLCVV